MQSLVGHVEEFGLYYKSSRKPLAGLKQRNAMVYWVFKRSPWLQSGEDSKKCSVGNIWWWFGQGSAMEVSRKEKTMHGFQRGGEVVISSEGSILFSWE